MKNLLKTAIVFSILLVTVSCSTQRMAERKIRRALELCPQLEIKRAYLIDTFLAVPAFTEHVEVPIATVLRGDTVVAQTEHGQIVVVLDKEDGTLHIDYSIDEQPFHYTDSISYSEVVVTEEKRTGEKFWNMFFSWLIGAGFGGTLVLFFLKDAIKKG